MTETEYHIVHNAFLNIANDLHDDSVSDVDLLWCQHYGANVTLSFNKNTQNYVYRFCIVDSKYTKGWCDIEFIIVVDSLQCKPDIATKRNSTWITSPYQKRKFHDFANQVETIYDYVSCNHFFEPVGYINYFRLENDVEHLVASVVEPKKRKFVC